MRTTVTLDADVEAKLRKLMRQKNLSFKEALNTSIRRGVADEVAPAAFKQPTFATGFNPAFDFDKALALSDAIEDTERVRKLHLRK